MLNLDSFVAYEIAVLVFFRGVDVENVGQSIKMFDANVLY